MHAVLAARLGEPDDADLVEQLLDRPTDPDGVDERRSAVRVEVDAQLVGPVDVGGAHRPGVEGDRAHLGGPGHGGDVVGAELVGPPAGREVHAYRLGPLGHAAHEALLVERVALRAAPVGGVARGELHPGQDALGPPLQRDGTVAQRPDDAVGDRDVVLDDLQLRDVSTQRRGRENDPIRAGNAYGTAAGVDLDRSSLRRHGDTLGVCADQRRDTPRRG